MAKAKLQKQLEAEYKARQHGYEATKNPGKAQYHNQQAEAWWAKAIRLAKGK